MVGHGFHLGVGVGRRAGQGHAAQHGLHGPPGAAEPDHVQDEPVTRDQLAEQDARRPAGAVTGAPCEIVGAHHAAHRRRGVLAEAEPVAAEDLARGVLGGPVAILELLAQQGVADGV